MVGNIEPETFRSSHPPVHVLWQVSCPGPEGQAGLSIRVQAESGTVPGMKHEQCTKV